MQTKSIYNSLITTGTGSRSPSTTTRLRKTLNEKLSSSAAVIHNYNKSQLKSTKGTCSSYMRIKKKKRYAPSFPYKRHLFKQ